MRAYLYSISRRHCNLNIAKRQKTTEFPSKIWKALNVHRIFVAIFPEDAQVGGQNSQLGGQNLAFIKKM
jgi:hypothetical protein